MVRRLTIFVAALLAVFTAAVMVAATASATELPILLPEGNRSTVENVSGSTVTFETTGGKKITCTSERGEQEENVPALGAFHTRFTGCESSGVRCTGLGDATTGEILELGTYHFVSFFQGTTLLVFYLRLLGQVHFECLSGLVLDQVAGDELCVVLNPYILKTLIESHCIQTKGVPSQTLYENDSGTNVSTSATATEGEKTNVGLAAEVLRLFLYLNTRRESVDILIIMR